MVVKLPNRDFLFIKKNLLSTTIKATSFCCLFIPTVSMGGVNPVTNLHLPQAFVQQEQVITGIIKNVGGEPLQGVTVSVKNNSKIKTSTDANGRFVLNVPKSSELIINLIGHI